MNPSGDSMLITADRRMQETLRMAGSVAPSRAPVFIRGESGTGKELLSKFIHKNSQRAYKRFVAINCAAVPDGLLESELFGYERGAFTGAHHMKPGKFELAHDSTLLLDEVTEMPLALQAKLLRVIQEQEVERLGGSAPVKINVRLISTTNRDVKQMVREGRFREDLYYRLNVIPLEIPPLRIRPRDTDMLARHFLDMSCAANGRERKYFSNEAMNRIKGWNWPGNVRELENFVERLVLLVGNLQITEKDLDILQKSEDVSTDSLQPGMKIQEAEKCLILKTLEHTNQNRTQAARLLGISIRTLRNKIHEYRAEGIL
jgi:transcriptional regulator with PAS, ATPase and Fis domain